MMKAKIIAVLAVALVVALAYQIKAGTAEPTSVPRPEDSGGGSYRLSPSYYDRLAKLGNAGDCYAAYLLGRHHMFYSLNQDEAIKWYRIAATCPNASAKGELIVILRNYPEHDAEVDRLLSEMETLDPETAAEDRKWIVSAREKR